MRISLFLFLMFFGLSAKAQQPAPTQICSVYPNPASTLVSVKSSVTGTLRIYASSGELVFFGKKRLGVLQLKVDKLQPGLYLVDFETADGSHHQQRLSIR